MASPIFTDSWLTIYQGDSRTVLREMPDQSVHMCMTSPPYFGLRDYQTGRWEGGDPECDHLKDTEYQKQGETSLRKGRANVEAQRNETFQNECGKCGAIKVDDQIGREQSPDEYVDALVDVFREVKRVLRDDGTLWLNIADSYAAQRGGTPMPAETMSGGEHGFGPEETKRGRGNGYQPHRNASKIGLKHKDMVGIPWRVAFALQSDGWYLRNAIVWNTPNPMPECLDKATSVFIRRQGWVSRIEIGDLLLMEVLPEILGPDGWVAVKKVWATTQPAMSIQAGKVDRVICSTQHRFPVSSERRRVRTRLETAGAIRHEGYADYFLYSPIDRFLDQALVTSWGGRELSASLGYLIGAYAAEGSHVGVWGNQLRWTIGSHEGDFADRLRSAFRAVGVSPRERVNEDNHYRDFVVTDRFLSRTIDAFVQGTAKIKWLCIELLLNTPRNFRQAVLDGYVHGDGSSRKGGGWIATSASIRLRDDVATLASSVGVITSKGDAKTVTDKRTGNDSTSHALWTPYMTRRKSKSGQEGVYQIPPRLRRMLGSDREMVDIEVEGGLFLIGDGLVTHNSVKDRFTNSYEFVFLFAKSPKYFFDQDAVREPHQPITLNRVKYGLNQTHPDGVGVAMPPMHTTEVDMDQDDALNATVTKGVMGDRFAHAGGRNRRDVWTIPTVPYPGAHYAVFPPALVEPCVKAGTPERGVCVECGAPWARVTSRTGDLDASRPQSKRAMEIAEAAGLTAEHFAAIRAVGTTDVGKGKVTQSGAGNNAADVQTLADEAKAALGGYYREFTFAPPVTSGWLPTCDHSTGTEPAVVLDCFAGSGTVGKVAQSLSRRAVLIDLNTEYLQQQMDRNAQVPLGLVFESVEQGG